MTEIKQQFQEHARDLNHVDKANLRQAADMASRVGEHSIEQRRKLGRLLESPYFGRIDCEVSLKRRYKIEKKQFRFMLESALNIQDNSVAGGAGMVGISRQREWNLFVILSFFQQVSDVRVH